MKNEFPLFFSFLFNESTTNLNPVAAARQAPPCYLDLRLPPGVAGSVAGSGTEVGTAPIGR